MRHSICPDQLFVSLVRNQSVAKIGSQPSHDVRFRRFLFSGCHCGQDMSKNAASFCNFNDLTGFKPTRDPSKGITQVTNRSGFHRDTNVSRQPVPRKRGTGVWPFPMTEISSRRSRIFIATRIRKIAELMTGTGAYGQQICQELLNGPFFTDSRYEELRQVGDRFPVLRDDRSIGTRNCSPYNYRSCILMWFLQQILPRIAMFSRSLKDLMKIKVFGTQY
jgi:hypothetical protein